MICLGSEKTQRISSSIKQSMAYIGKYLRILFNFSYFFNYLSNITPFMNDELISYNSKSHLKYLEGRLFSTI